MDTSEIDYHINFYRISCTKLTGGRSTTDAQFPLENNSSILASAQVIRQDAVNEGFGDVHAYVAKLNYIYTRYSFAGILKGLEAQLLIAGKINKGETYNN